VKLLSRFDRVWAASAASRDELLGFWGWQGVAKPPAVEVLPLGADWDGRERETAEPGGRAGAPRIVSVGILEPRKHQEVLLDACQALRGEGLEMELHLVGRVNPHFGAPLAARVAAMRAGWPGLRHSAGMGDAQLAALVRSARATALPSIAEGCGLPLLESLWLGVPCLCSPIAPFRESAAGCGCEVVATNDPAGWRDALRRVLTDDGHRDALAARARTRELPTWAGAARILRQALA